MAVGPMSYPPFSFRQYQKETIDRFELALRRHPKGWFDEQALPAYTNPNPLMRWVFWKRVRTVIQYLDRLSPFNTCMDFGCGLGTMIPYLQSKSNTVLAVDLNIRPLEEIAGTAGWSNIVFSTGFDGLESYSGRLDMILAMDVLEHVIDLEDTIQNFARLLKPTGFLLISGPTENGFYRLGRMLAGYSGHYHIRNIYDIRRALRPTFTDKTIQHIFPGVPLFLVIAAVKK
jgi:2-polyprenyl-3-methyl-5-hydroxy-6-metoxy-1,4-benzoquinol methylase